MRSMWDRIAESPVPVNKLAAMVASCPPLWMRADEAKDEKGPRPDGAAPPAVIAITDVTDVSRPPPGDLKDFRGLRSRRHVVLGYAHKREKVKVQSRSGAERSATRAGYGGSGLMHRKRTVRAISAWYVLSDTGEIFVMNSEGFLAKLKRRDEALDEGRQDDWQYRRPRR